MKAPGYSEYPQYAQYGPGNAYAEPIYYMPQTQTNSIEEPATSPSKTEDHEEPLPTVHATHRYRNFLIWLARYVGTVVVVAGILVAPVAACYRDADSSEVDDMTLEKRQYYNLIFYIFLWLLIVWCSGVALDVLAMSLPYAFRLVTRYLNPGWRRYWRLLRAMRFPIVLWGSVLISYLTFSLLIPNNELLSINVNKEAAGWDDVIADIHFVSTLWASFYVIIKIGLLYITIHHHTRSSCKQIVASKELHTALVTLYQASVALNPVGSKEFELEDTIIRNAKGLVGGSARQRVTTYLSKLGVDSYGITSFFGNFFSDDPKSHWFKPASGYAVVERSIAGPTSAAALARRIWFSLVASGSDALTADDIAEVLGPDRTAEAKDIFKVLDVNDSGDLRLDELIWTIVEAGTVRHNIYQGMHDADHCINTLKWVILVFLAALMIFYILIFYVPAIKEIQQTLSFIALGLSFAAGRTVHHFLVGVVYVFFDHPFDVGDRCEIYNFAANNQVTAIVTRQSLLYTVFRRVDNGVDLQIQNERLASKRIENVSRSGMNRQALSIFVDMRTTFTDILELKSRLLAFVAAKENRRDYQPDVACSIVSLHELNKIELRINFGHKSNWSNEKLRATRSNRFMCNLLATLRSIPIYKPGGLNGDMGDPDKPIYHAWVNDVEATEKMAGGVATRAGRRFDFESKTDDDDNSTKAAQQMAEKAAADQGALKKMTAIPAFPPEYAVKDTGSSSAVQVEQMITSSATGRRLVTGQRTFYGE